MKTEEIELEVAGIAFLVKLSIDEDGSIDKVEGVQIYDVKNRCYVNTNANTDQFYKFFEDYIIEAHDNHIESQKDISLEIKYDSRKEDAALARMDK